MDKQLFLDMYFIVLSTYKIGKEVSSISAGIQKCHLKYEHDCITPVIKTTDSENKKCKDVFILNTFQDHEYWVIYGSSYSVYFQVFGAFVKVCSVMVIWVFICLGYTHKHCGCSNERCTPWVFVSVRLFIQHHHQIPHQFMRCIFFT